MTAGTRAAAGAPEAGVAYPRSRSFGRQPGVPAFDCTELAPRRTRYCVLIPIINEGERIARELERARAAGVCRAADVIICDGGSTDGSTAPDALRDLGVNTLLVKRGPGRQGAQLRMGIWFALERGYEGVVTVDGNNKDGVEAVHDFLARLDEGYDLVQGSRFVPGGVSENLPLSRNLAVRLVHAPVISLTAGQRFTDTTNAFRAYSRRYLTDERVQPLREVFQGYELLAYLSTRAPQLGMRACEIPVSRVYPKAGKTPTKISPIKGNLELMRVLLANVRGAYLPGGEAPSRG